jgi:hypothetical protein
MGDPVVCSQCGARGRSEAEVEEVERLRAELLELRHRLALFDPVAEARLLAGPAKQSIPNR